MTAAIAIGLAAGVIAGMLGVGGGVLFVPGLVFFVSLNQHQAEATSLLASFTAVATPISRARSAGLRPGL